LRKGKQTCPVCGKEGVWRLDYRCCSSECSQVLRSRPARGANPHPRLRTLLARAKQRLTVRNISERLDCSEKTVRKDLAALKSVGYSVNVAEDLAEFAPVRPGSSEPLIVHSMADYKTGMRVFGACGDNHLGSKHERRDVLNAIYDVYADEGVTEVFNTGNWIEGEAGRLNFHDIKVFGMDDQLDYWIENYPQRPGITTHFVAGDDHEGWYQKRERVEIGRYAMLRARAAGRNDLVYLGYMEADVELKAKRGSRMMKVMHPGGGSAYALSYAPQKIVEALQGGEKPNIILIGHYHKFDLCFPREVWCLQTGCTVDQSVFMRKCKIQAHVGGCLVWINQAEDGRITRFRAEFLPFYDRGFYRTPQRREFTPVVSLPVAA